MANDYDKIKLVFSDIDTLIDQFEAIDYGKYSELKESAYCAKLAMESLAKLKEICSKGIYDTISSGNGVNA